MISGTRARLPPAHLRKGRAWEWSGWDGWVTVGILLNPVLILSRSCKEAPGPAPYRGLAEFQCAPQNRRFWRWTFLDPPSLEA